MNIFINYKIKLNEFFKNLEKKNIIKLPKKFDNFSVEIPKIKTHGDLSTNAPMTFAKENNLNPIDLATIIKKELEGKFKEIIKKKNKQFKNEKLLRNEIIRSIINFMVTDLILHTKKKIKKLKIKTIEDVYKSGDFLVSFSPKLISANNQIREFLRLNMYENKSVKKMTNKAEIIIKNLYIYLIKNNKKFILPDLKKKWGLERSVSDFIAGMTDKFAIDLYNKIK